MIFDTHVHICDSRYDPDRGAMLSAARQAGVTKFLNIGAEHEENIRVLDFREDGVFASVGLHPHYAEQLNDESEALTNSAYREKRAQAVGEIGLDFFKSPTGKDIQMKVFRFFMKQAVENGLPVIIHSREAHGEVYAVLKEFGPGLKGIIHCYTGGLKQAEMFAGLGFIMGIGGVLTFPNAGELRETVEKLPAEFIAAETDAPWLAPQPERGKRNEPAFIRYVIEKIAEIRHISFEETARLTTANAVRALGL